MIEKSKISDILQHHEEELLEAWVQEQLASYTRRPDLISDFELRQQSAEFLQAFRQASQGGDVTDITNSQWDDVREILTDLSRSRAQQGFTASETATFVFSLKQPLFVRLRQELEKNPDALAEENWRPRSCWISWGYSPPRFTSRAAKPWLPGSSKNSWSCRPRL
jgi:rsbT co-antagonist protein RsbR